MSDPREELRRLIDSVDPVTDAEARARAVTGGETEVLVAEPEDRDRRPLVLAAAAVVVVVVAGLFAWQQEEDAMVTTGSSTSTTLGSPSTVLAPIGDDPLISCDALATSHRFPISSLSAPVGAELIEDPPTEVLRDYLAFGQPPGSLPPGPWRRIVDAEDLVLFMGGDLDLADLDSSSQVGFVEIRRVDGTWAVGATWSGRCDRLTLDPGEGNEVAIWRLAPNSRPVGPSATTLRLEVYGSPLWCPGVLDRAELVGPQVVESEQSVTVRVAFADPAFDPDDCEAGPADESPIEVTVALRAPLGDRQVLDGNVYPAGVVDLDPPEERSQLGS